MENIGKKEYTNDLLTTVLFHIDNFRNNINSLYILVTIFIFNNDIFSVLTDHLLISPKRKLFPACRKVQNVNFTNKQVKTLVTFSIILQFYDIKK
jgi:hypothetical protein